MLCFTDYESGWLFKYDCMSGNLLKFEHSVVEFEDRITVQINKDLYLFSMEPLAAYKCEKVVDITALEVPTCIELATTDHNREDFSVTNFGNCVIYITGGLVDCTPSNSVLTFHISDDSFCSDLIPSMNESRCNHSSTVAGGKVWVFGGSNSTQKALDTIEVLDVMAKKINGWWKPCGETMITWQTIKTKAFTARLYPSVCAISPSKILICGGSGRSGDLSSVLMFDTVAKTADKIFHAPFEFRGVS